jgi:hypothetical protein
MPSSDRFDQYAQDEPTFTQARDPYVWQEPSHWQTGRGGGGRPILMGTGGTAAAGGGGAAAPDQGFMAETGGDRFDKRWRQSEERAARMRQQYEGTRDWNGSPQDYNDAISPPNRGMEKVTNGPRLTGMRADGDDWDAGPSPVRAKPNGG